MASNKFKVVECEYCGILTYRRTSYKTVRCPNCHKKMLGDPIEIFANVRDALAFIQERKLQNAPEENDWFETFDPRWNSYFLGIYFGDEPGGKMLDDYTRFHTSSSQNIIEKWIDGCSSFSTFLQCLFKPADPDYIRRNKMSLSCSYGWFSAKSGFIWRVFHLTDKPTWGKERSI